MNSKVLYMNLYQVLSTELSTRDAPSDFDRPLFVHVSRNNGAGGDELSHVTLEYAGVRSKFFCCLTFDGSGDAGTGLGHFAMPKMKITLTQKALMLLGVLEYLTTHSYITASFDYLLERVSMDLDGGLCDLRGKYAVLCRNSRAYIEAKEKGQTHHALSQSAQ